MAVALQDRYSKLVEAKLAAEIAGACILAFFQPPMYGAYIAAIGIATKAADEILLLFVKDAEKKE